ncbi:hypothetical protein BGW36DRAFT_399520 [Talaromyces proteolyticus]|uniref:BZIP domain-containing protein n=1 Tax=Talaromyces proteolyticus TaxID=1131652 RepID=A0AAD4KHP6_9EURO|nr:uncharacterized protein BGW36DRAFT_399520 [Talaromyces proteolyticus]KAH8692707.1 hypothetical protein BGW36DRAFT_399520 [Talaromyces proteolyticus]
MASLYNKELRAAPHSWPADYTVWPEPCLVFSELQDLQSPRDTKFSSNYADPAYGGERQYQNTYDDDELHAVKCQKSDEHSQAESRPSPPDCQYDQNTLVQDKCKTNAQKRKVQNRLAQRAYRERKENYIQNLLKQIDEINQQHMRLIENYRAAKENIICLQIQVEDLQRKFDVWNNTKLLVLKVGTARL